MKVSVVSSGFVSPGNSRVQKNNRTQSFGNSKIVQEAINATAPEIIKTAEKAITDVTGASIGKALAAKAMIKPIPKKLQEVKIDREAIAKRLSSMTRPKGGQRFTHKEIAEFSQLDDSQYARALQLADMKKANGDYRFDSGDIVELAKLDDEQIKRVPQ